MQRLLRLRREHPALQSGTLWQVASDATCYIFLRESPDERVLVAFSNAPQQRELAIATAGTPAKDAARARLLLGDAKAVADTAGIRLALPAHSLSMFSLD